MLPNILQSQGINDPYIIIRATFQNLLRPVCYLFA